MGVKYSYDDFTTKGHGVIEYADPHYNEDENQKPKRRSKSKYGTRWPSPSLIKKKSQENNLVSKKILDKQARQIFKQRNPGQQPKKGQIKVIIQELYEKQQKQNKKKLKVNTKTKPKITKSKPKNKINELAITIFKQRNPGQQPTKRKLKDIRLEVIDARRRLGL